MINNSTNIYKRLLVLPLLVFCVPTLADNTFTLPKVDTSETRLGADKTVFIGRYRVTGNTVIDDKTLVAMIEPYTERHTSIAELDALKDNITQLYIDRGYINSGAIILAKHLADGFLNITIIEGKLTTVTVNNNGRLTPTYIDKRVSGDKDEILNINTLEQRLQQLRGNRLIKNIDANLLPGEHKGESALDITVEEAKAHHWQMFTNNYSSSTVGTETLGLNFQHHNVSGYGDSIELGAQKTENSQRFNLDYAIPLGKGIVSIGVQDVDNQPELTGDEIFDSQSLSDSYSLGINYPTLVSRHNYFEWFAKLNYIRNDSDSEFKERGLELIDTNSKAHIVTIGQYWNNRHLKSALSIRSSLSYGEEFLNVDEAPEENRRFFKWLGQVQYARRISRWQDQLILRGEVQLSSKAMLTNFENFVIGGHNTVRGYRENTLSSERGALASIEWRVPLWKPLSGTSTLSIAPFFDYGYVTSSETPENSSSDRDSENISSVGVGLLWKNSFSHMDFYYGHALKDINRPVDTNLQDEGIHLQIGLHF